MYLLLVTSHSPMPHLLLQTEKGYFSRLFPGRNDSLKHPVSIFLLLTVHPEKRYIVSPPCKNTEWRCMIYPKLHDIRCAT